MNKHQYARYLREKFTDLKRQFLNEIRNGKNFVLLQALNGVIITLDQEIQLFPEDAH